MKCRRGFTLLELSASISMSGVVMLLALRCFHVVFLQAAIAREFADCNRQWGHLSEIYRRDVHAAQRAEPNADGSAVRLFLPQDRIARYAAYPEGVERLEELPGKKNPPARFRLWDGAPRFAMNPEKTVATLIYQWSPAAARAAKEARQSPPSRELRLEANIGSDERFSSPR